MWEWFKGLFIRDERCLFRYFDGVKQRAIDPVATHRLVWNDSDCNLLGDSATANDPKLADGSRFYPLSEVHAAEDRLRTMTRKVFGVKEWSESQSGLTVDETDQLLANFLRFCDDFKKKRNNSPTPSARTVSMAPPPSLDTADSSDSHDCPDGAAADSCSIASESNAAAPTGP